MVMKERRQSTPHPRAVMSLTARGGKYLSQCSGRLADQQQHSAALRSHDGIRNDLYLWPLTGYMQA